MTDFISHVHTDIRKARTTLRGATHKADDVPQYQHKEYLRMKRIMLPEPGVHTSTLAEVLRARRSGTGGDPSQPFETHELGSLLGMALKKHAKGQRRPYPSGGGLYPIETYLCTDDLEGGAPILYHYNPSEHALERLWGLPVDVKIRDLAQKSTLEYSAIMIFTSVWQRSSAKYGDLAYQHALLEAGHMSQNVLLAATALGILTRPMAGFDDDLITKLLDLDVRLEQPVHSIVLSKRH